MKLKFASINVEVKNEWNYGAVPPMHLPGLERHYLSLPLTLLKEHATPKCSLIYSFNLKMEAVFPCNVATKYTFNTRYYSHFMPTCFGITIPSSGSTLQASTHLK